MIEVENSVVCECSKARSYAKMQTKVSGAVEVIWTKVGTEAVRRGLKVLSGTLWKHCSIASRTAAVCITDPAGGLMPLAGQNFYYLFSIL